MTRFKLCAVFKRVQRISTYSETRLGWTVE